MTWRPDHHGVCHSHAGGLRMGGQDLEAYKKESVARGRTRGHYPFYPLKRVIEKRLFLW